MMIICTILFLVTFYLKKVDSQICVQNNIERNIFPCINNIKRVNYYWNSLCSEKDIKLHKDIELPCDLSCPKGYFLELLQKNEKGFHCQICPKNTYSNGGDLHLKGKIILKQDIITDFKYLCFNEEKNEEDILKNQNCGYWSLSIDNDKLTSGISSVENVNSTSSLFFVKYFQRDGLVIINI